MEKLKTDIMLYALKEIKKANIGIDVLKDTDIQEAIYQLEDIVSDKAFIKNKSKNNKYVDNNVHIRLRDIIDLIKMKLKLADFYNYSSEPTITLSSSSARKINTKLSIKFPSPYEEENVDSQRTFACSYLVNSLVKMLLPYVSKTDFSDTKQYFEMEMKRRNELELKKEELINEAEV
tara:strand:+ start:1065 stop:1595 length:531 start_codon:yes stop_codon:yes gene_type:complete